MGTVELVGRLLVSLAVVLGLIWFIAKRVRGGKGPRAHKQKLIDVVHRQQLSRSSSVAVVRVHDRALILGVTDAHVSVLGDLELDAVQAAVSLPAATSESRPQRSQDAARSKKPRTGGKPAASKRPAADPSANEARAESIDEVRARLGLATATDHTDTGIDFDTDDLYTGDDPVSAADFDDEFDAALRETEPRSDGALAGSALSPATWKQTMEALREMTARKG